LQTAIAAISVNSLYTLFSPGRKMTKPAMVQREINMVRSHLRLTICKWAMLIGLVGFILFTHSGGSAFYDQDVFVTVTS
jgi:hypothetical protein